MQGLRVDGADMESDVPELVRFPAGTERIVQIAAGEIYAPQVRGHRNRCQGVGYTLETV